MKPRLYIVVDEALTNGERLAQACHAVSQFTKEHPATFWDWYNHSRHIVVLQCPDVPSLARRLADGHRTSEVREPALGDRLTAVAAEPRAWRALSSLPLAR